MRHCVKSIVRRSGFFWLVPAAFLALPNCSFTGLSDPNLETGDEPLSSAVFCDIEDKSVPRHCASPEEVVLGISLSQAAVALTRLQSSNIGLDYSPQEIADHGCGPGQPVAIRFKGRFPDGSPVCLNCGEIVGPVYADANEVCVVKCEDLNGSDNPPLDEVVVFCTANARTSTNAGSCFSGACTDGGGLKFDFADPRRVPEAVEWADRFGTEVTGPESNTLYRNTDNPNPTEFNAGAASTQSITRGDGYVEFTATETNKARALGLAIGGLPDTDYSLADINFAVRLSTDGHVFIFENGALVPGPNLDTSFAAYASGDRIRLAVSDNLNGNASITYLLIPAACPPSICSGIPLRTVGPAPYPFRVDASIRDRDGTLTDVRVVRIK